MAGRSEQVLDALHKRLTQKLGGALEAGSRKVQADGVVGPEVQEQLLLQLQQMSHVLVGHMQGFAATNCSELVACEQQIEGLCQEAGVPSAPSSSSQAGSSSTTDAAVLVSQRALMAEALGKAQEEHQNLQAQLQQLLKSDPRLADAWKAMQAAGG